MHPTPKFTLWRDQRVVLARISGSWNTLTAEDYAAELKRVAKDLRGQTWAHINFLDNWQLGVPEIEPVIQDLVRWCVSHDLRYSAHVYGANMLKQYQLDRMIKDHKGRFERRIFTQPQDAFVWLASMGFNTDSQA